MTRRAGDGAGLLAAFRAAVDNLAEHVDEVNALNVFPVPDGDTGSNMLATVRAALAEAEAVVGAVGRSDRPGNQLRGADGRSRQLGRHRFADLPRHGRGPRRKAPLRRPRPCPRPDQGTATAYKAVVKPVEGTILTVIREAAAAAVVAAEQGGDLEDVLTAAVAGAREAVAKTPSMLPILRDAGVVDAGGAGPVPAAPGCAAVPFRARSARRRAGRRTRPGPFGGPDAIRSRGLRLRDDVPAPRP